MQGTAFEAQRKACRYLARNVLASGFSDKVDIVHAALGTELRGVVVRDTAVRGAEVSEGSAGDVLTTSPLSANAVSKLGLPDLVKMDIEGGELRFFRSRWIVEVHPWVADEISPIIEGIGEHGLRADRISIGSECTHFEISLEGSSLSQPTEESDAGFTTSTACSTTGP